MAPTLRIRITPQVVRVEVDGAGVLLEEEAAIAVRYDARVGHAWIAALGRDAVALPERLRTLDRAAATEEGLRSHVVPVAEAAWWDRLRGFEPAGDPPRRDADPWEHHGEVVIANPFASATLAPRAWLPLLWHARSRAFAGDAARRLGPLRRWWLRWCARVSVEIPELPADTRTHDQVVRSLWQCFGTRVEFNGARAELRAPTRLSQLGWEDWFGIAGPVLLFTLPTAMLARRAPVLLQPPALLLALFGVAGSLAMWRLTLQRGPSEPAARDRHAISPTKALRRHAARGTDVDPAAYAGEGSLRLGVTSHAAWLSAGLTCLGLLFLNARFADPLPVGSSARLLELLLTAAVGLLIGALPVSARLSIGQLGITLRVLGWLSLPQRIPYTRIRQVAAVTDTRFALLRIVLQDGHEVHVGFAQKTEARMRRLRDLEATLTARLTSPGSYRAPGGGVSG